MREFEEPIRWEPSERKGPITPVYVVQTMARGLREVVSDVVSMLQTPIGPIRSEPFGDDSPKPPHIH